MTDFHSVKRLHSLERKVNNSTINSSIIITVVAGKNCQGSLRHTNCNIFTCRRQTKYKVPYTSNIQTEGEQEGWPIVHMYVRRSKFVLKNNVQSGNFKNNKTDICHQT